MTQNEVDRKGTAAVSDPGTRSTVDRSDADKTDVAEALKDSELFEAYDEAIGDLGDAGGAASMGGPAA